MTPPRRRLVAVVLLVLLSASAGACTRSAASAPFPNRTPRHPDAEGVVTAADAGHLTIDGVSRPVSPALKSFAAGTLGPVPLRWRLGQYVQVGLSGGTVTWLEGIGAVVRAPGRPPVVYFSEVLQRAGGGFATFADGTVLRLGAGVGLPHLPSPVLARIDPVGHAVVALQPLDGA